MGHIIDRVRNRQWCAENRREIMEIDERAAARRLARAIMEGKRDVFDRITADLRAEPAPLFVDDDVQEISRLCFGGPL